MEPVILAINKKYEVIDFVLHLGFHLSSPSDGYILFEPKYNSDLIDLQILSDQPQNKQIFSKLWILNDQISISESTIGETGIITFLWVSKYKDKVQIKMRYEVIADIQSAANQNELKDFLTKSIDNYQELNRHLDHEGKIYRFINPHLQGVDRDLTRLKKSLKITYRLDNKKIKLLGYKDRTLYEYARNHRKSNLGNNISLEVQINKNGSYQIDWDGSNQCWCIHERDQNIIPLNGMMEIQLGNPDTSKKTLSHDERRLLKMKDALLSLKNNINGPGNSPIKHFFDLGQGEIHEKSLGNDLKKLIELVGLKKRFTYFDKDQQKTIDSINSNSITFVTGVAGTGKTEIGAYFSILAAICNKRCLIASETNDAVKNVLDRINQIINKENLIDPINIVRIHSRNDRIGAQNLVKFEMENVIEHHKALIETKCQENSSDARENELRSKFKKIFADPVILEEIIPLTFDIVISTYGSMAERRFKKLHIPEYDYNLIEASSGINTATFVTSGAFSRNWIFLDDELQLTPTTIGMFVPSQKLRVPETKEIEHAKEYIPNRLDQKKIPKSWGEWEYKKGVKAILKEKDEANKIIENFLRIQYRIHPKLYELICKCFDLTFKPPPQQDPNLFLDLSPLSFFKTAKNRLIYCDCNKNTLVETLTQKLEQIITELNESHNFKTRKITIGVTGMDVSLVRAFIKEYRISKGDLINDENIENAYSCNNGNIQISFSSIKKHQEKQYDIFVLGTHSSKAPSFIKQLYTAITRARSYVILCGPVIQINRSKSSTQTKPKPKPNILSSLRRGLLNAK